MHLWPGAQAAHRADGKDGSRHKGACAQDRLELSRQDRPEETITDGHEHRADAVHDEGQPVRRFLPHILAGGVCGLSLLTDSLLLLLLDATPGAALTKPQEVHQSSGL